jgi:hypothetical protein
MIVFIINTETMPYGQVTGTSQGKNVFVYLFVYSLFNDA